MTRRRVRVLSLALAGVTGLQAIASGSRLTGLVFAVAVFAAASAFAPLLLQLNTDERDERRAGRGLGEMPEK